jgi:hypothetical protein
LLSEIARHYLPSGKSIEISNLEVSKVRVYKRPTSSHELNSPAPNFPWHSIQYLGGAHTLGTFFPIFSYFSWLNYTPTF